MHAIIIRHQQLLIARGKWPLVLCKHQRDSRNKHVLCVGLN